MLSHPPILLSLSLLFSSFDAFRAFVIPSQQKSSHAANKDLSLSAIKSDLSSETSEASDQNIFGVLSDKATGLAFDVLHAFDDDPIQDSSKNLRVLWVRALLNQRGLIDDPISVPSFYLPLLEDLSQPKPALHSLILLFNLLNGFRPEQTLLKML